MVSLLLLVLLLRYLAFSQFSGGLQIEQPVARSTYCGKKKAGGRT